VEKRIAITAIKVGDRFRRGSGLIDALIESIRANGLLHPIVVTSDNVLIAGKRRLEACRELGWTEIPCTVIDPDDPRLAEADENRVRIDFTPSEAVTVAKYFKEEEQAKAKERQATAGPEKGQGKKSGSGKLPEAVKSDSRDALASRVGMSGRTLEKATAVVEAAKQEPEKYGPAKEEMDRTGKVDPAYKEVKGEKRQKPTPRQARDPLDTTREPTEHPEIEKDSNALYHLKRYWRQATKKDRKEFRRWIDENEN